ncbi:MAG: hypothetical protein Q4E84_01135 [Clostridia bacterium]|nr:hypothetical protein [Clostridia bacterium]MDO5302489.1 hypothetical protein [Clostridia bacterium]
MNEKKKFINDYKELVSFLTMVWNGIFILSLAYLYIWTGSQPIWKERVWPMIIATIVFSIMSVITLEIVKKRERKEKEEGENGNG